MKGILASLTKLTELFFLPLRPACNHGPRTSGERYRVLFSRNACLKSTC